MNERIRELAEQAGFQYIKDEKIGWAGNYNSSLPKFAELIVRECAFVAQNKDDTNIDLRYGRGLAAGKILEHFGVEE